MPTQQELNQFRRLIGDFHLGKIADQEVNSWLDDAANELTIDFATPYYAFDGLPYMYHNETIQKAAINWWWNKLSELQVKISVSVGNVSADVSAQWERAMQMISTLSTTYENTRTMGYDIHIDNYSRWSKQTLRRIGGIPEEDTNK